MGLGVLIVPRCTNILKENTHRFIKDDFIFYIPMEIEKRYSPAFEK